MNAAADRFTLVEIWCNIPRGSWAGVTCTKPLKVRVRGRNITDITGLADYGPGFAELRIGLVGEGVLDFPFSQLDFLDSLSIEAVEKRNTIAGLSDSRVRKLIFKNIRQVRDGFALHGMRGLEVIRIRNCGSLKSFSLGDAENLKFVEIVNARKLEEFTLSRPVTLKSLWLETVTLQMAKQLATLNPQTVYVGKSRLFPNAAMAQAVFPGAKIWWSNGR